MFFNLSSLYSQTYINKKWIKTTGAVSKINRTVTKIDNSDNIIVISNILNGTVNKTDVLITKYDFTGVLLWQKTYNGVGNGNDYGVQVEIDANNDIYVAAAINGGSISGMDFGMLKYSSSGVLLMSKIWNALPNGADVPADIKLDSDGNIYLVGASEALNGLSDYAIIKYDSTGLFKWFTNYDFSDLHDAATSLTIENTLVVTGASANTLADWDYATIQIDKLNGTILNTERTSVPGLGFDNALDVSSKNNNYKSIRNNRIDQSNLQLI